MFKNFLIESITEYEKAHDIARINAAKPTEQGGLGLPENNSAMDRAKAMGYTIKAYHGTKSHVQYNSFKINHDEANGDQFGRGLYFTDNIDNAKVYSGDNGQIIPVLIKSDNILDLDSPSHGDYDKISNEVEWHPKIAKMQIRRFHENNIDEARQFFDDQMKSYNIHGMGYDSIYPHITTEDNHFLIHYPDYKTINLNKNNIKNMLHNINYNVKRLGYNGISFKNEMANARWHVINNPNLIRSIHAAFDPLKKYSSNIMD